MLECTVQYLGIDVDDVHEMVDRDVLDVDVESMKDTRVLSTYFAGKKVYSAQ